MDQSETSSHDFKRSKLESFLYRLNTMIITAFRDGRRWVVTDKFVFPHIGVTRDDAFDDRAD